MSNINKNQIENLVLHGRYQEALNILNSIEKQRTLLNDESLIKKYIYIFICLDKGEFERGRILADEMIAESQKNKNILREIDALIAKTENTICLTLFNESFQIIEKAESILNKNQDLPIIERKRRKAYLIYLKGRICQDTYKIHKGINYFKKSYKIRKEINEKTGMIWSLLNMGILTIIIGDFQESEQYITKSLNLAEELDIEVGIIWCLIHLGWIKYHLRDFNALKSYADRCLSICKLRNYKYALTFSYDLLGHYYLIKGDLSNTFSNFKTSLNIREEEGYNHLLPNSYYSIGEIYSQKGELRESLIYYKKAIDIHIADIKEVFRPICLSTIGRVYAELGDFLIAEKYLLKALELLNEKKIVNYHFQNFSISTAKTYHCLIVLSLNNKETKNANYYISELQKYAINLPNNTQIQQIYRLDEALILKSSDKMRDNFIAGIILKEMIEEDIIDHEVVIEAMTNLCEVLIYELELTGNKDILQEIEGFTNKLLNISLNQYLYNLQSETYLFKAKISLLYLNFDNARLYLTKAQKIAAKYDLNQLAKRISEEHDSLLRNLDELEKKANQEISLQERIKNIRYEFLFSKILRSKTEELMTKPETAIYLVILGVIDGHCLYERSFQETNIMDGNLIAGFISAINSFGQETFSTLDTIDRIKHGDFFIIIQSKDDFLFGYVFKGDSYPAISKLNNFVKKISEFKDIYEKLSFSIQSHLEIAEDTKLKINQVADNIFFKEF